MIRDYRDIKKGDIFFCFKTAYYDGTESIIFKVGNTYKSAGNGYITNHNGNKLHSFTNEYWAKYLVKISLDNGYSIGDKLEMLREIRKHGLIYNPKTKTIYKK